MSSGKSAFEEALIGRRVSIRSLDWKSTLTGVLLGVEKYGYILKLDVGGTLLVLKHSVGAVAPLKEEKEP